MPEDNLKKWQHSHDYSLDNPTGERRTQYVLALTAVTMVVEIIAGTVFGSMALLADGWHMGTHLAAFLITLFAYRYARKYASDPRYAFSTGKVNVLGGFASAITLAVVALVMFVESIQRIFNPQMILFNEAIGVALVGLLINVLSALLLRNHHSLGFNHSHDQDHAHDHNLKAAYLHVLADAMTSVLAILALSAGRYFNWYWLDPMMGMVGAVIITRWSYGLVKQTGPILLDASLDADHLGAIKDAIISDSDNRISDIHIWKISPSHYAAIVSIVTCFPKERAHYKRLLEEFTYLSHVSIEVLNDDSEFPNQTYS